MQTATGFLLSYIKYGDNDAVLNCFTKESGFQTFFVKGIYSAKNKKKAYLLPLKELQFGFNQKARSGAMPMVSKIEPIENPEFYNDIKANSVVFFVADFLNQILRNESASADIYCEIVFFLNELELKNYRAHYILLFKILENQGFLPLMGEGNFLNPEKGIFVEEQAHQFFDEDISAKWKEIISSPEPYTVRLLGVSKKQFLDSVLMYCHYHLTDFRTPASLEIIQQIFE